VRRADHSSRGVLPSVACLKSVWSWNLEMRRPRHPKRGCWAIGKKITLIRLSTGWTVRASNLGRGEIFRTRPDRPRCPPSLLYNGYRFSLPAVKRLGHGFNHPFPSGVKVKERVQLYLYSPSGPSWFVKGRTLPFTNVIKRRCIYQSRDYLEQKEMRV
jgi:hypothetical protein